MVLMEPKLRVERASKIYDGKSGPVPALDDISLDVAEGELVTILGPSGCGKTTLLWAISGLHALTGGRITLDGTEIDGPRPQQTGMIFQDANLLPWRNLRQNIEFPFEIKRKSVDRVRVDALLQQTGLTEFVGSMPRELSGGMQQRASIVRALAQNPEVLLLDEPFGALDAFTRDEMNLLLLRLWQESGQTIVFVTHNISEAIFLADRVVVFGPRPARVREIVPIDLPRPRRLAVKHSPRFRELEQTVWNLIESEREQR